MILPILVLIGALTALYQYFHWASTYWRRRGIPGPEGKFFYGNYKEVNASDVCMEQQLREWTKRYGRTYGMKEGVVNVLVVSDPEVVNDVFFHQFDNFYVRRASPISADLKHDPSVTLFQSNGARWKRLRAISAPTFSVANLKKIRPLIEDSAKNVVRIMKKQHLDGKPFNIALFYYEYTMDVICRLVLGQKESMLFNNPNLQDFRDFFALDLTLPAFQLGAAFPFLSPRIRRFALKHDLPAIRTTKKVRERLRVMLDERIEDRAQHGAPSEPRDFIDLFLNLADDFELEEDEEFSKTTAVEKRMTVEEINAQAFVFLAAGYDTTSNALAYSSWMLVQHPEVQRRCQEEIDELCTEEDISYEECTQLTYLDAVCKETLRFYPLATRAVSRTCVSPSVVGGVEVEPGTVVQVDTLSVHFDKGVWGDDAEQFLPERWLDVDRKVPSYAFLPFGAGNRLCIGQRLAFLEEKLALAHILRNFTLEKSEQMKEMSLVGGVTTTPKEVVLTIRERKCTSSFRKIFIPV